MQAHLTDAKEYQMILRINPFKFGKVMNAKNNLEGENKMKKTSKKVMVTLIVGAMLSLMSPVVMATEYDPTDYDDEYGDEVVAIAEDGDDDETEHVFNIENSPAVRDHRDYSTTGGTTLGPISGGTANENILPGQQPNQHSGNNYGTSLGGFGSNQQIWNQTEQNQSQSQQLEITDQQNQHLQNQQGTSPQQTPETANQPGTTAPLQNQQHHNPSTGAPSLIVPLFAGLVSLGTMAITKKRK